MARENNTLVNGSGNFAFCYDFGNEICMPKAVEVAVIGVNTLSMVLNIFHMVILLRLKKRSVPYKLVVITTAVDILDAFQKIWSASCGLCILGTRSMTMVIVFIAVRDISSSYKLVVQAMSVLDRWLSLAKPFEYKHLIHVKHFNSVTAFTLTLIPIFTGCEMCIG